MDDLEKRSARSHELRLERVPPADEGRHLAFTQEALGIRFPPDYVARGKVYSLFNRENQVCGGAMVITEPPFRSVLGIPCLKDRDAAELENPPVSTAEINGVWLAGHMRLPYVTLAFWKLMIRELLANPIEQFLFTFDDANGRMLELVQWASPRILYQGPTRQLPGMKRVSNETVALIDRQIIASLLKLADLPTANHRGPLEKELVDRLQSRSKRRVA